jgi:hypothetical protein
MKQYCVPFRSDVDNQHRLSFEIGEVVLLAAGELSLEGVESRFRHSGISGAREGIQVTQEGGGRKEWTSKEQRFMKSVRIYASASDIAEQSHRKRRDPSAAVSDAMWYHLVVLGRRHAGKLPPCQAYTPCQKSRL